MTLKNWIRNKKVPSIFIAAVLTFSVIAAIPTAHSQTIIFQDDYSTNTGWTQVPPSGTNLVTVDDPSFPDIVKLNGVPDGSDRRVFKSLGTTLSDTEWILESELLVNAHSGNPSHRIFALTAGTGEMFASNQDAIGILYTSTINPGIGLQVFQKDDTSPQTFPGSKIVVGIGDKVYITLARTSTTTGTLEVFSDAARTIHVPGSPVALTGFSPTVIGLNTLQHANGFEGSNLRNLTAEIDNTTIFAVDAALTCDGLTPSIEGTGGDDLLTGTPDDDVIVGLGGNDVIIGNGGNDTICGGDGNDLIRGGSGDDTIFGDAGKDLIMGESGDDVLNGDANDDQLVGGSGDDTLKGNAGDDMLVGNAGDDSLNGGNGTVDICDDSDGFDTTAECELPI